MSFGSLFQSCQSTWHESGVHGRTQLYTTQHPGRCQERMPGLKTSSCPLVLPEAQAYWPIATPFSPALSHLDNFLHNIFQTYPLPAPFPIKLTRPALTHRVSSSPLLTCAIGSTLKYLTFRSLFHKSPT